ncbi:hypothetical protein F511_35945 [Dorcoceras hygrometricum]|uniref:Uncharacterized protein n=1 Tax=Dorcoceras hygrometricum TaxID=472368 RepID=A0A2Z7AK16_9LAMI|nr:hypothetical protein F511_35945 [Dorcoceras hygrometricum]
MRRVVNYHSSWARQRQVELLMRLLATGGGYCSLRLDNQLLAESITAFRSLDFLSSSPITLDCYCSSEPYFCRLLSFLAAVWSKIGSAGLVFSRAFD